MAVEMHVLFHGKLPDKKTLSRAMAELEFPLTIAAGSLERQRGFMPMRLRREETGVEFDVFNDRTAVEELGGKDVDRSFERSANFRWAGDEDEMLAGLCAAAALARLVNGVVLEEQEGKLLSPDEAIALARESLRATLKPKDTQRRGTRPADIRRYLKSLLKQRGDLVLVGRLLIIRPLRHVLRGVFFDRRGKDSILAYKCMNLLCQPLGITGYGVDAHASTFDIWQPHLEPLLIDTLAQEIFEQVGKITSLDDYAAELPDRNWFPKLRATAFHLSGPRERAAAYARYIESRNPDHLQWKPWYESQRGLLKEDIRDICARYHATEVQTVKELRLESVWEPSPFPVEVPAARRKQESDEPLFVPSPWPARPEWLLGNPPEEPGEVRFAKGRLDRDGHPLLVVPLSREQARQRHQDIEGYVLAARLTGGLLLLLRWPGLDRHDPRRVGYHMAKYSISPHLELHGTDIVVRASFIGYAIEGTLLLHSVHVDRRETMRQIWGWSFDRRRLEEFIRDERGDTEEIYRRPLSDDAIDQLTLSLPGFGDFGALVEIMLNKLRSAGYGEIT
jgi:hypothetical protein